MKEDKIPSTNEMKPDEIHELAMKYIKEEDFWIGHVLLIKADNAECEIAKSTLGYGALYGIYGLKQDTDFAIECFIVAAMKNNKKVNGSIRAFKELKKLVEPELEMKQDKAECNFNLRLALDYLISCYQNGWGTEPDLKKANDLRAKYFKIKNKQKMHVTFNLTLESRYTEEKGVTEQKEQKFTPANHRPF